MKILINGPNFFQYNNMIARAFNDLGVEVKISNWPDFNGNLIYRSKFIFYNKIAKFDDSTLIYNLLENKIRDYNNKLLQDANYFKPDIVLTLKGDIIFPETVKKLKMNTNSVQIIWCYDSALRYNNILSGGRYYDFFYTFEPTDIQKLKKFNIKAEFLPMAFDPNYYFKLNNNTKNIDLSFIGNLNLYPYRKELLENLIIKYQDLNIKIWNKSWTWYNLFSIYEYKIKRKKLGNNINNYNISPNIINEIYNNSKICLNIHHPQSQAGLNPRTFEILGAGGFELVEYKMGLDDLFEIGNEIECYENKTELFEKIEFYLDHENKRDKIAQFGHEKAMKNHTFENRAKKIIENLPDYL